ncbi:tubulin epsilon and delta complex protein 2 isoform X2 [Nannospalax galili]|uniref:tubulin epsilon and delta complex protein 2 isoform X2 n=1 Tax=Nannospalax galili TaxID=1026970 RepID=UPI000819AACE|nr:tubulin epsilon and delta complex protein 2 isoform X2 [Nannospalax galili]
MLPIDCARRLVSELQGALDSCSERQRQLERSLRVSRRLLRAWEPAGTPAPEPPPEPETKEEDPTPACTPSAQDLKELELLTQALEKAVRVRKGMSKAGQDRAPSLTSTSIATPSGTTASAQPQVSSQTGSHASSTRPTKGIHQAPAPTKDHPECRLISGGVRTQVKMGAQATRHGAGFRDQQIPPSAALQATEAFTLKEMGLWAQLSSTQTSDFTDATRAAKTQFLQKLQMASGWPSHRPSAAEVEVHAQSLRKACALLRLRMQEELSTVPADWMQEYRCLLTLEGLQAIIRQCLHRLQMLRAAVTEQLPGPWLVEKPSQALSPYGSKVDFSWSPEPLFYSSTQELQTLATLKLQVSMLNQQIHLEKVLMAELLPLINTQEPRGPPWLALCRAAYSLLCEGSEHFLTVLQDD